jgi:solute carrier family 25 protein 39/40
VSIALQLPASVFYYALYEKFKAQITNRCDLSKDYVPLFAGSMSRSVTTLITSPLEYLRTSIQASAKNQKKADLSLGALKRDGYTKLWRGLTPTLLRDVPFSAIYWGSYEFSKSRTSGVDLPEFLKNFTCGYAAGVLAASITCPIDVVKTRMQSSDNLDTKNVRSDEVSFY